MELFIGGKRYKDFRLRVTVNGIETHRECFDVNELKHRLTGREEIFQKMLSGKTLAFVRSEPDYTTTIEWAQVPFRTGLIAETVI